MTLHSLIGWLHVLLECLNHHWLHEAGFCITISSLLCTERYSSFTLTSAYGFQISAHCLKLFIWYRSEIKFLNSWIWITHLLLYHMVDVFHNSMTIILISQKLFTMLVTSFFKSFLKVVYVTYRCDQRSSSARKMIKIIFILSMYFLICRRPDPKDISRWRLVFNYYNALGLGCSILSRF